MALLDLVLECQYRLADYLEFTDYEGFEMTRRSPVLTIDVRADGARLNLGYDLRWEAVGGPSVVNDVEHRVSLDAADDGFRVTSFMGARLQAAVGDHPPGNHVLRDERSGVLSFDQALVQLTAGVKDTVRHSDLLLRPPKPVVRAGVSDEPGAVGPGVGSAAARVVAGLLSTVDASRRELHRTAASWQVEPGLEGETSWSSQLDVQRHTGALLIQVYSRLRAQPCGSTTYNDLDFELVVEITPAGFRVVAQVGADLQEAMGTLAAGEHGFHRYRSAVMPLDQAMAEAGAQVAVMAALDTYPGPLGLVAR